MSLGTREYMRYTKRRPNALSLSHFETPCQVLRETLGTISSQRRTLPRAMGRWGKRSFNPAIIDSYDDDLTTKTTRCDSECMEMCYPGYKTVKICNKMCILNLYSYLVRFKIKVLDISIYLFLALQSSILSTSHDPRKENIKVIMSL